ncbi:MAG: hypothetical protein ACHQQR_04410 [Gemmatimonadales bacterium]
MTWLRRLIARLANRLADPTPPPIIIPAGVAATITLSAGVIVRGPLVHVEPGGSLNLVYQERAS